MGAELPYFGASQFVRDSSYTALANMCAYAQCVYERTCACLPAYMHTGHRHSINYANEVANT
eukprot:646187-Pelagomonas_calceolata.AAC.1